MGIARRDLGRLAFAGLLTAPLGLAARSTAATAAPAAGWSFFKNLGGDLRGGPTVTSWDAGRLDIFGIDSEGRLAHKWFDGNWKNWQTLGAYPGYGVVHGVSWGPGRIDLFGMKQNGDLLHRLYSGGQWSGWHTMAGNLALPPAVASWGPGRLDVLGKGKDNRLHHRIFDGGQWYPWRDAGPYTGFSAPGVAAPTAGRLEVFASNQSTDEVFQSTYSGEKWSGWTEHYGSMWERPSASSWGANRIDLFGITQKNALVQRTYAGGWKQWRTLSLNGTMKTTPSAVSWGPNRIDVFGLDMDDNLLQILWTA